MSGFSLSRFISVIVKEFVQMRRDRLTFLMMIGIPVMQTVLFGYAINFDPKEMPTAVINAESGLFSRNIISGMENSGYFSFVDIADGGQKRALRTGSVQFVLEFPVNFDRRLLKGERPEILIEADATDPVAASGAISAIQRVVNEAVLRELKGPLSHLRPEGAPVGLVVHKKFNPEGLTNLNIVPGLLGVVLTLTMTLITAVAVTRERERGTLEYLLSTPATPLEVITGKVLPYVLVGYVQMGFILLAANLLFDIPLNKGAVLLVLLSLIFILANLSVGITFSTLARNQLQAMQMSFFFFLPSLLLSGFMFPFRGMPGWAQSIGSALPLTHYLRLVRGLILKNYTLSDSLVHLWPIGIFLLLALIAAVVRYRETLD